jgi:hypothetical protein
VPEKKPPIRTKTTTMTMLSQTSLTGGALLGVVGQDGRSPQWCPVAAVTRLLGSNPLTEGYY